MSINDPNAVMWFIKIDNKTLLSYNETVGSLRFSFATKVRLNRIGIITR